MRLVLLALILSLPRLLNAGCETILATDSSKVSKTGDTMTGTLSMSNVPAVLSGPSGYVTSASSVNASQFFGNGSALTGIPSTGSIVGVYLPLASGGVVAGPIVVTSTAGLNATYGLSAGSATLSSGLTASSGTFTATGNSQASVRTSSGIVVAGTAGITAAFLTGNAGTASALAGNGTNCSAGSYSTGVDASGNAEGCTVAGTGTGDSILSATETASGAKTFLSSVTFNGPTPGMYIEIASGVFTGATSVTFANPLIVSSAVYRVEWDLAQVTTNGHLAFRFNGDSGSNYRWSAKNNQDNTDETQAASTGDSSLRTTSTICTAGGACAGSAMISTFYGKPNYVFLRFQQVQTASAGGVTGEMHGGGGYNGSAALSSITVLTSGGTISGNIRVYRGWEK